MFIKLNHHDTLALIEMLETQLEPLSEQETKTLKKLRLIYEAQKLSRHDIETNVEDNENS